MSNKIKFKLIVGLGNPDEEYQNTFHNVGRLFIDYLISKITGEKPEKIDWKKTSKTFSYYKNEGLIFIKPLVFMNNSGKAIAEAIKQFKIKPEHLLIAHDDVDILLGQSKLSFNRGSAGHKGVESIMRLLKTKEFWRLRIGIGRKKKTKEAADLVLVKIGKKETEELKQVFKQSLTNLGF